MEIWKTIEELNGLYEVSNIGRIRSIDRTISRGIHKVTYKGKIRKTFVGTDGYIMLRIKGINIKIHRCVAKTFISNPHNKRCVNHINGIKTDNRVENLEWCTSSENNKHAFDIGLKTGNKGNRNALSKFTNKEAELIKNEYEPGWGSISRLARKHKVKWDTISNIVKGVSYAE